METSSRGLTAGSDAKQSVGRDIELVISIPIRILTEAKDFLP
jgi:hypothetical protein